MTGSESLVVGVDASHASTRALRWALEEARRRGCPVHAIMVWESHAVLGGPAPLLMQPKLAPHHIQEEHRQNLTAAVRTCMSDASTPEVHTNLVEGHPAEALVGQSKQAAMLVLGNRGHGRATEVIMGSTALRCVHKAHCPVVIIPVGMEHDFAPAEQERAPTHDPVLE